ncbi:hypothetical protein CG723_22365 [Streptomyces sp. CB01635]|nr:hypothetical protein CG723_22365 [Streptomyces sp. CB01635]
MEYPVVALPEVEYRRVWDRFYEDFRFRPSTSSRKWSAILLQQAEDTRPTGQASSDVTRSCISPEGYGARVVGASDGGPSAPPTAAGRGGSAPKDAHPSAPEKMTLWPPSHPHEPAAPRIPPPRPDRPGTILHPRRLQWRLGRTAFRPLPGPS